MLDALDGWQRELGFTLIAVDHRPDILRRLCPSIIAIEDGVIVARGDWQSLIANPATPSLGRLLDPA
jgi:ABC-type methionine transport system ATPase subunit